jgi:hypothetical protein
MELVIDGSVQDDLTGLLWMATEKTILLSGLAKKEKA